MVYYRNNMTFRYSRYNSFFKNVCLILIKRHHFQDSKMQLLLSAIIIIWYMSVSILAYLSSESVYQIRIQEHIHCWQIAGRHIASIPQVPVLEVFLHQSQNFLSWMCSVKNNKINNHNGINVSFEMKCKCSLARSNINHVQNLSVSVVCLDSRLF